MMTVRAPLTALLLAVAIVLAWGPPAHAGGPTSAILSVPGEGKTASVYYTDDEYDQLARLVGAFDGSTGAVDRSGASHENGPGVTVTWLIHDVEPWRVDRIYLDADGGPWIATQTSMGGGSLWDSPVVWHQPTGGKELSLLLDELGVGQAARAADDDVEGVSGAAVPQQTETEAQAPAPAASDSVSGVWWGLGGLAGGVLLALGWMRLRATREDEPELDPATDWLAPQARSSSTF